MATAGWVGASRARICSGVNSIMALSLPESYREPLTSATPRTASFRRHERSPSGLPIFVGNRLGRFSRRSTLHAFPWHTVGRVKRRDRWCSAVASVRGRSFIRVVLTVQNHGLSSNIALKPACRKCTSAVRASSMPSCFISTNEMQSVRPHSLSSRSRKSCRASSRRESVIGETR